MHERLVADLDKHGGEKLRDEDDDGGLGEVGRPIDQVEFTGLGGRGNQTAQSAGESGTEEGERDDDAAEHDKGLEHIGPDDRLEAAFQGVKRRDYADESDAHVNVEPGDGAERERRQQHDDAHAPKNLEHHAEAGADELDAFVEAAFEVGEDGDDAEAAQQVDEDEPDDAAGEGLGGSGKKDAPVGGISFGRKRHEADAAGGGGEKADRGGPPRDAAAPEKEVTAGGAFAAGAPPADPEVEREVEREREVVGPRERARRDGGEVKSREKHSVG